MTEEAAPSLVLSEGPTPVRQTSTWQSGSVLLRPVEKFGHHQIDEGFRFLAGEVCGRSCEAQIEPVPEKVDYDQQVSAGEKLVSGPVHVEEGHIRDLSNARVSRWLAVIKRRPEHTQQRYPYRELVFLRKEVDNPAPRAERQETHGRVHSGNIPKEFEVHLIAELFDSL